MAHPGSPARFGNALVSRTVWVGSIRSHPDLSDLRVARVWHGDSPMGRGTELRRAPGTPAGTRPMGESCQADAFARSARREDCHRLKASSSCAPVLNRTGVRLVSK